MSRIVIYGEYPPSPGPSAAATLESVRSHLAGSADVQVVSPLPSAAHHTADLGTVRGAALLARLARGADLDLTLDPALLAGKGRRAPAQALLALAIHRAQHSTVRLEPLGGAAGRGRVWLVLGAADSVVAASPDDALALERARLDRSRLSVRAATVAPPVPKPETEPDGQVGLREPWDLSEDPGREELEAAVRRRAADDRGEAAAGTSAVSTGPLHRLGRFTLPPSSGKPPVAMVKRMVYRLTLWVLRPLVKHVNELHQATIESMNSHAALPDHAGDREPVTS